ncbi:MAG: hypothetical protein HN742_40050 [Lentisphaerae bacterium]|jgi:cell division protein FtsZ|nr:hypothetical protein [Lentisphaerota bacterium]MBT4818867.1 hypothetical protein [Lentisphaerota bacterium]MBT5613154.1 hypothetical protein [Lentisphaerota bacterium]MBT7061938.1 hypothetical protein [Lentisphaerota bacterium]MBT7848129.1 hypothetical protein [Lentisphaerota bacterium]
MNQNAGELTVIGLGGGGCRIAATLAGLTAGSTHWQLLAADTDTESLSHIQGAQTISLGQEWVKSEGCGGDAVLGERATSASADELRSLFEGSRMVIVAAGLGGGTSSGGVRVLARLLREMDLVSLFVVTLPFAFEGSWRQREAEKALVPLRDLAEAVIVVPNDLLFTELTADTPATQAFTMADGMLAEGIHGLTRVLSAEGLITADFATLKSILRQRQATCALGVGQGTGEDRWQAAIDSFIKCPFVGSSEALADADAAIVTLCGGMGLSVGEVRSCLTAFQQYFSEDARVVVGAYADDRMGDDVQITGLLCRYRREETDDAGTDEQQGPPAETPHQETSPKRRPRKGKALQTQGGPVQGELPLQEQSLGIFTGVQPTTIRGENLDIPTFQRRGIHPDVGD